MRTVFCGSGRFAVPSLRAAFATEHELVSVVTQPARAAGRGGSLRATPVAEAAAELGVEAWPCPNINAPEALEALGKLGADVLCVADFGQMIRQAAREQFRLDAFSVHASLLPALRGAAPINWALIRGHKRTGVTTFSLVDAMDAGPIYVQTPTDIRPDETAEELRARLADLGAEAACRTLDLLASGEAVGKAQDHSQATPAPRMKKSDGRINWSAPAQRVCGLIRGTWPWPGGQTVLHRKQGKPVPVVIARAAPVGVAASGLPAGQLDEDLCVAAGEGRVRIEQIKPAGKRLMAWQDFAHGYRPVPGDRFGGPEP